VALDQGATGPAERASGLDRDLRRDHPYAHYAELPVTVTTLAEGGAYARSRVRAAESSRCASASFSCSSGAKFGSTASRLPSLKD
jgi:NADH:ubiquinone oxidoreductase subunit D